MKKRAIAIIKVMLLAVAFFLAWKLFIARKSPEQIARMNTSETGWMLVCDTQKHMLAVFKQSDNADIGECEPVHYNSFPCSTGALVMKDGKMVTSTPIGVSRIKFKQRRHIFDDSRSWYNCWCKGGFGIHSTLYSRDEKSPLHEIDGRLGINVSTSCIRVRLKVAKWIYKTIPVDTPVIVY